jgi:Ribbon-helix-helix protein, copG family
MSQRCTIRLPDSLLTRLQEATRARGEALSDLVRRAVQAFLDGQGFGGHGTSGPLTDPPAQAPPARAAACPPVPPAPPVSGAARPRLREISPWKEYRRRGSQDPGAPIPAPGAPALPGSAESASTPAPPSGG